MPKPTDMEIFKPRRDGLFERKGTWGEVTVGSKILGRSGRRGDVWEVLETAVGKTPAEFAHTLWFKVRSLEDGQIAAIPPQSVKGPVVFLCEEPDAPHPLPPRTPAADADAVRLLAEELGATLLWEQDRETGEITCPDYNAGGHNTDDWKYGREEAEHLRLFHHIDATGMDVIERTKIHGRAHNPKHPESQRGTPHRHVPEDLTII